MTRYGFIGTGSMGEMLISQFTRTGCIAPAAISASSKSGTSALAVAKKTGITAKNENRSVAANSDVLFLCVKPLEVQGVIREIRSDLKPDILLISIAACVSLEDLAAWTGSNARCVRIIPSVTALQNSGVSLVVWGRNVHPSDKILVLDLFNRIGTAVETDEESLEVCTNLTSCGPALIAAMMSEFGSAVVRSGTIRP
ncbi:MAG: NAD(P)-binding domain-containing protein [Methanomicrobiales archaeon]|nr:NAD(P)-binding domain-containing protein [Methanomicrobiales archaeon]